MKFIMFLFAVFGTVEILILGEPTRLLRDLLSKNKTGGKFIRCPLCLGFWVGMFWGYWFLPSIIFPAWYLNLFVHGCLGAGGAYFLHGLMPPSFGEG